MAGPELRRSQREQRYRCELDGETLDYTVIRSARRRKQLALLIAPDGAVLVRAPLRASDADIRSLLQRNGQWLRKTRRQLAQRPLPAAPQFCDGEYFPLLGERYQLRVDAERGAAPLLEDAQRRLLISGASTPARIEAQLQRWYRGHAERVFTERLSYWSERLPWVEAPPPLRLRRMRSRWGSCSAAGRICLNSRLIMAPLSCIDSVIVHELCHLQVFNHSPAFYQLMDAALPEWRRAKTALAALAPQLLHGGPL